MFFIIYICGDDYRSVLYLSILGLLVLFDTIIYFNSCKLFHFDIFFMEYFVLMNQFIFTSL